MYPFALVCNIKLHVKIVNLSGQCILDELFKVVPQSDSVYPVRREGRVPGELPERLHQPLPVRRVRLRLHQEAHELAVSVLKQGYSI